MGKKQKILMECAVMTLFLLFLLIIFGESGIRDLNALKRDRVKLQTMNSDIDLQNRSLSRKIWRLKNDGKYIEDVVRKDLKVIGKDDLIIRSGQ